MDSQTMLNVVRWMSVGARAASAEDVCTTCASVLVAIMHEARVSVFGTVQWLEVAKVVFALVKDVVAAPTDAWWNAVTDSIVDFADMHPTEVTVDGPSLYICHESPLHHETLDALILFDRHVSRVTFNRKNICIL